MANPRILTIDIETSPSLSYHWGMWQQNISLPQLVEPGRVICWAAKWLDKKSVIFKSVYHHGHEEMVTKAHELLSEADIVVHYNGKKFDIPWLNTEFERLNLGPTEPFFEIDLLTTARGRFKFASNKLDHITSELGLSGKLHTTSFQTWIDCINGNKEAWSVMRSYNKQDVVTEEELYRRWVPWIRNHPNVALIGGATEDACNKCGSTDLRPKGFKYTATATYKQFVCRSCGGWCKGNKAVSRVNVSGA